MSAQNEKTDGKVKRERAGEMGRRGGEKEAGSHLLGRNSSLMLGIGKYRIE